MLIINPDHVEPVDGIYPEHIANNLLNFLYFLSIFFLILGSVAVIFTIKYEETYTDEKSDEKDQEYNKGSSTSTLSLLLEGFLTIKNLILGLFCFCGPCKSLFFNIY